MRDYNTDIDKLESQINHIVRNLDAYEEKNPHLTPKKFIQTDRYKKACSQITLLNDKIDDLYALRWAE